MKSIEQNRRKFNWLKSLLGLFCVVFFVLLVIWASVMFWLGPRQVETRLINDISAFWDGQVTVVGIDFRLFHPITVESIILKNKTDRPCLEAKGVALLFKKWPSSNPQLTGIELHHLDLMLNIENGKPDLSLHKTDSSSAGQQEPSIPLDNFKVENFAIHLLNAKNASMVLDGLSFSAVHEQGGYDLSLKQHTVSDSDHFTFSGKMNSDDSQSQFSLLMAKHIGKKTVAEIQSLLNLPLPFECAGDLSADIIFSGTQEDFAELKPAGTILLKDGSIFRDQAVWAEKLNASIQVNGSHVQVKKWTADSFAGQITGTLDAEIRQNKLARYQGQIEGKDMQASSLMEALTAAEKSGKGILTFGYAFSSDEGNLQKMEGHGTISLEQVDYQMLPFVQQIISTLSLGDSKIQKTANAIGTFEVAGSVVTFQQARLANDWVAIETLPGGTISLQTGQTDTHVIVAPIKQIRKVLNAIPVVKLFINFKDQLTCLHVQGNSFDTSDIKITKEPLRDVAKGTLEFVQGVASTGGDFVKKTMDESKALLKETEGKKMKPMNKKGRQL